MRRRSRNGVADVVAADAKVSGRAVLTTDARTVRLSRLVEVRARRREPPENCDLFTIDIDALTVISVDGGHLVVDQWSTTDGRKRMRRS